MTASERTAAIALRSVTLAVVGYGLIASTYNLWSFTYFTILSNIFVFAMTAIFLVKAVDCKDISNSLYTAKYLSTVSITLTFLVFMTILAPTSSKGFVGAYFGHGFGAAGSFCVHFLGPLLAIVDFLVFDYAFKSGRKHVFLGVVPPLCYCAFVYILAAFGMRWGQMTAPYNFMNYASPTGWFGFDLSQLSGTCTGIGVAYMIIVLVLIFIGIASAYLAIKNLRAKKRS